MTADSASGSLVILAPDFPATLRELLEARRLEITLADCVEAAVTRIEVGGAVDALILDLHLPHGAAIALIQRLRMRRSPLELSIIGLGRNEQTQRTIEALSCGANDVINLPSDPAVFFARIQSQLTVLRSHRKHIAEQHISSTAAPEHEDNPLEAQYADIEFLSRGGYATIYKAVQRSTGQTVAVKLLHTHHLSDDTLTRELTRFEREMVLIGQIQHPHIVRLIDAGRLTPRAHLHSVGHLLTENEATLRDPPLAEAHASRAIPYIVMEHLIGETLLAMLKRKRRLDPLRAVSLMLPVISAVDTAHSHGVLHRDLKPSNIFLDAMDSGQLHPRVLDFGIAKLLHEDAPQITLPDTVVGTPSYMSPEQIRGSELTAASDQYALGVLLYVCLTGRVPHSGRTLVAILESILDGRHRPPRSYNSAVPEALSAHILRAMRAEPRERFPSLKDFADALRDAAQELPE